MNNRYLNKISYIDKWLIVILAINFIGIILTMFHSDTIMMDEIEHLRASYFISLGDMPYRDFFEHHHPLIWFMFAPIISILPKDILLTYYTARTLALIFSIASTYFIYKIVKFFTNNKTCALFSLVVYFMYYPSWYSFSIFKPDTFTRFFYLCGVYFFFLYYKNNKRKDLAYSVLSFTIAFLFLQTIAFSILPFIIFSCYFIYNKKNKWKDFAIVSIIPISIIGALGIWFYYSEILAPYIQLNWIYNRHLFDFIHTNPKSTIPLYIVNLLPSVFAFAYIIHIKKTNAFFYMISFLCLCELIQHTYFIAVYPHYLILLFLYSSIITAYAMSTTNNKKIIYTFISFILLNVVLNLCTVAITNNKSSLNYMREYNKNPEASMVNFNVTYFSIYAPRFSYYWFYPNFEYMDNSMFDRLPDYNINDIIQENNVEFIAYNDEVKLNLNMDIMKKYYNAKDYYDQHNFNIKILENYEQILPKLYKRKN